MQLDGTISTIEFGSTNTEELKVMGDAATALKSAHKNMDADDAQDVAEQQEIANEISEAILNPAGFGEESEEADLMAELEELEQEELDEQLLQVTGPSTDHLPSITTEVPATTTALQALKKKKRYETQLRQVDGSLSTLEVQRDALESAASQAVVLDVMGQAVQALQAAHRHMGLDDINEMMDTMADELEVSAEIGRAFEQGVGFGNDMDEDELLAELEELEQEALNEELVRVADPPLPADRLPSVPDHVPASPSSKTDEAEMEDLMMWTS